MILYLQIIVNTIMRLVQNPLSVPPSWDVYVTFMLIGVRFKPRAVDGWSAQSDGSHF